MELQKKNVLIVGMARSGVAAAKVLCQLGACVTINDLKDGESLGDIIKPLKDLPLKVHLGEGAEPLVDGKDLIVISPSVPIESAFIMKARSLKIPVLSEIELGYLLCHAPIAAITGTNGKTTTTALTGEIFKNADRQTFVVGNIGIPFVGEALHTKPEDVIVAEISSFQLEGIHSFHPKVSAILNITEDHMNRHKTMENYIAMKSRIFENQDANDYLVLNYDDPITACLSDKARCRIVYFSRKEALENGAFVEDQQIKFRMDGNTSTICRVNEVKIPGSHNLENALAAAAIASVWGISPETVRMTLKTFKGVEHRLEFVEEINGIRFVNDSKGTNPDASIKAIQAMENPTVLIAGGMNKGSDFTSYIDAFSNRITALVVLGETSELIRKTAEEKNFFNIHKVESIEEAVEKAYELAKPGENVLLSPACASWDMFRDFEERGCRFKDAVYHLRR